MMENRQLEFYEEREDMKAYRQYIKNNRHSIALLLDQLNDVRNIGAICRLADAARLEKIFAYRMDEVALGKKFKRVARTTNEFLPFVALQNMEELKKLQETYQFVALEITNSSIPYTNFIPDRPCLLIAGNEQYGVSSELLNLVEQSIHIPMYGINTSMNVAMSVGIAVYGLLRNLYQR